MIQLVVLACKWRAVLSSGTRSSTCKSLQLWPFIHSLFPFYRSTDFSSITSKPTTPPAAPRWWAGSGLTWYPKSSGLPCPLPCSLPNQTMLGVSSSRSLRARRLKSWQQKRVTRAVQRLRGMDITSWNTCLPLSQQTLWRARMKQ